MNILHQLKKEQVLVTQINQNLRIKERGYHGKNTTDKATDNRRR